MSTQKEPPKAEQAEPAATPTEEKVLPVAERYSEERTRAFLTGEISGRELHQVTGPAMLAMAVLGFQQYEQGRYPEAQSIFEMLIGLDSSQAYYWTALGATFLAQEDYERAEHNFSRALARTPEDAGALVNRGEVYFRTGRLELALKDFQLVMKAPPTENQVLVKRAQLLAAAATETLKKQKDAAKKAAGSKAPPAKSSAPGAGAAKKKK